MRLRARIRELVIESGVAKSTIHDRVFEEPAKKRKTRLEEGNESQNHDSGMIDRIHQYDFNAVPEYIIEVSLCHIIPGDPYF